MQNITEPLPPAAFTEIAVILDRSGSMQSIASDAIGGFNAFLAAQRREPGTARLSLVLFDDHYEVPLNSVPLAEVPDLTAHTFVPRGSTALFDAVGRTLDETAARSAALPAAQRPEKTIIAILTDGEENASRHFSREQIRQKITHFRELLGWEFVFLAANQDAFTAAAGMGILREDAANFVATPAGAGVAFSALSDRVSEKRQKIKSA